MSVARTELGRDRVRVHLLCKRPWGTPDDQSVVEVPFDRLATLPPAPPLQPECYPGSECWDETVALPEQHASLVFRFAKWKELADCDMEVLVGGPFLAAG